MVIDRYIAAKDLQLVRSIGDWERVDLDAGEPMVKYAEHFFASPARSFVKYMIVDKRLDAIAAAIETAVGLHVDDSSTFIRNVQDHGERPRLELARALSAPEICSPRPCLARYVPIGHLVELLGQLIDLAAIIL